MSDHDDWLARMEEPIYPDATMPPGWWLGATLLLGAGALLGATGVALLWWATG